VAGLLLPLRFNLRQAELGACFTLRAAMLKAQVNHDAHFTAFVFVFRFHRITLPSGKCSASDNRPTKK